MGNRNGEKIGWIGGWLGGFIWVVILSVIFLVQEKLIQGIVGLMLVCVAGILIIAAAPWKHPKMHYWKLMLPLYVAFFGSVAWAVWSCGGPTELGLSWWNAFWVLPLLLPFGTVGGRRWNDFSVALPDED
jgi:hypothetical protein